MQNLAKTMATFNFLQGKKVTYGQIERFLKKSFDTGPLMIFSGAKNEVLKNSNKDGSQVRISWNKRTYGSHYPQELMDKVFEFALQEKPSLGKNTLEGRSFYIFESGEDASQHFYGVFELTRDIEEDVLHLFNLFMGNIAKGWTRLDELKKVEDLVHVDDVTGLYNQRKLLKDIELAVERYREFQEVFSILFIDVDHFKNVNDGHGHLVGTQLLNSLGQLLKNTLRESDLIYRYGGDEFVMVIPDVPGDTGKLIGDRVLSAVKKNLFKVDVPSLDSETEFKLTVSVGVATYPEDASTKEEILSIADRMMYEAKQAGRGRVCYTRDILNAENIKKEAK